jgi:hypothetical protein
MDATQITQLVVAITALVTAIATLAKVFQHDGILTETKATVRIVQHQTNGQIEALQARVDTLQAATKTRLEANQATPAELVARDEAPAPTPTP